MSDKTSELFNTFTKYYWRFLHTFEEKEEETIDFVKRFCNIERLEVDIDQIWDVGSEAYENDVIDHSELPVSEWNEEQHAVWQAFRCCLYCEDTGFWHGANMMRYALEALFTSANQPDGVLSGAGK